MNTTFKRLVSIKLMVAFLLPVAATFALALPTSVADDEHACCQTEKVPEKKSCSTLHASANGTCPCPDMQEQGEATPVEIAVPVQQSAFTFFNAGAAAKIIFFDAPLRQSFNNTTLILSSQKRYLKLQSFLI